MEKKRIGETVPCSLQPMQQGGRLHDAINRASRCDGFIALELYQTT